MTIKGMMTIIEAGRVSEAFLALIRELHKPCVPRTECSIPQFKYYAYTPNPWTHDALLHIARKILVTN